ncbi:hypothetical protein Tsubulata_021228 [Turnera subulata]|uniref:Uncharacterized protein n=1 Tax=Turnera subulata TaxID=218843 RepID=A0A9Q0FMP9_9ROSI|nr:hypothetical protein Tsubulata_021228 [Turnera subulata]
MGQRLELGGGSEKYWDLPFRLSKGKYESQAVEDIVFCLRDVCSGFDSPSQVTINNQTIRKTQACKTR